MYQNSCNLGVYALSQQPAKASYNGLSVSAYEALMDDLMKGEQFEAGSEFFAFTVLFHAFAM